MTKTRKNKPKRILVADDNKDMRDTIIRLLEPEFDIVGVAADGKALIDLEAKLHPEIGVIDISMPVMSGIDAARELRSRGSEMQIIFLTVNEDADFVNAAFETGAVAYVVKRQMASDLPKAMRETLAGRNFVSACIPGIR